MCLPCANAMGSFDVLIYSKESIHLCKCELKTIVHIATEKPLRVYVSLFWNTGFARREAHCSAIRKSSVYSECKIYTFIRFATLLRDDKSINSRQRRIIY